MFLGKLFPSLNCLGKIWGGQFHFSKGFLASQTVIWLQLVALVQFRHKARCTWRFPGEKNTKIWCRCFCWSNLGGWGNPKKTTTPIWWGLFCSSKRVIKIWQVETSYGFSVAYLCIFKKPLLVLDFHLAMMRWEKSSNKKMFSKFFWCKMVMNSMVESLKNRLRYSVRISYLEPPMNVSEWSCLFPLPGVFFP